MDLISKESFNLLKHDFYTVMKEEIMKEEIMKEEIKIIYKKHLNMSDSKYTHLEKGVKESYPNSCILWIEELFNERLTRRYKRQKRAIIKSRGYCNEMEMYHGSTEEFIDNISRIGFKVGANRVSAYGIGTYFAKKADYSKDYGKPNSNGISFLLVCDVLVGECVRCAHGHIDTTKYDNSVDQLHNPSIVVTPYDNGAVPRFIVAFYKNAR